MSKSYLKKTFATIALLLSFSSLSAMPAKRTPMVKKQPDGTTVTVRLMGDEHFHYYLSEDRKLLVNDNETFCYGKTDSDGNIINTKVIAHDISARTANELSLVRSLDMSVIGKVLDNKAVAAKQQWKTSIRKANGSMRNVGLFTDTHFPSKGEQKGLVILVDYKDTKFTVSDPNDYFYRMLNETGFSDYGATGCAAEYFRTNSSQQFKPTFDVYGPITLSKNMSYYGGNDYWGNDKNPQKMVIEACQQLDATVDFTEYDRDNDGYIDNVYIYYAGMGEASGGSGDTVWPHSWNVTAAESQIYKFDGVILDKYACGNEWDGSKPDGVGTFIHEFSHVLGLPDLYSTSYTSAFTPGAWSVMDYGPYNNDGCTPPLYSVFERYALEWIEPTVLDGPNSVSLKDISYNKGCVINTNKSNEFFMFENRQKNGWDTYIPGHGMLIWHIDYDSYQWDSNTVNDTPSHQYVDIEEADNTKNEYSREGDSFPGTNNVTSFTDNTNPSMKTWAGVGQNLPITNIREESGIIRFDVAGGRPEITATTALEAENVNGTSFLSRWNKSQDEGVTYNLSVYTKSAEGKIVYAEGYNRKDCGTDTCMVVSGLNPETDYYYVVYVMDDTWSSDASNEISVRTNVLSFAEKRPTIIDAEDVTDSSFIINWSSVDEATDYVVNLINRQFSETESSVNDFSGGLSNMPEGWTTNSKQSYASTSYSGEAIPALRLVSNGQYIESPYMSDDIHSMAFWTRGANADSNNVLLVKACNDKNKWVTADTVSIDNTSGGKVVEIDHMPQSTRRVRIEYLALGSGSVAIDDVIICWGGNVEETVASRYVEAPDTTILFTGLNAESDYYVSVTALKGDVMSQTSEEMMVRTRAKETTGIHAMSDSNVLWKLCGNTIRIENASGEDIVLIDPAGRMFSNIKAAKSGHVIKLPSRGVFILRIGNRGIKIGI